MDSAGEIIVILQGLFPCSTTGLTLTDHLMRATAIQGVSEPPGDQARQKRQREGKWK